MRKRSVFICLLFIVAVSALFGEGRREEKFPDRPIRIVVPFSGGLMTALTDVTKILLAEDLGVNVISELKPGGGSAVGLNEVQHSPPDVYTIGSGSLSIFGVTHATDGDVDYRNFELIANINEDYVGITVHVDSPWKTLEEFIAYAKANPEQIRIGHTGFGGPAQIFTALFEERIGVKFTPVPFGGGAQAVTSLLGNHIEATAVSLGDMTATLPGGQLRVLALASPERNPFYPDVPTVKEITGVDLTFGNFRYYLAPKGTPPDRIKILEDAIARVMQHPTYIEFCNNNKLDIIFERRPELEKKVARYAEELMPLLKVLDAQ